MVALVLVCSATVTVAASAEPNEGPARAAARRLGYEGVAADEAGQYAIASEKLEKAYAVVRVPSLGLWSARALVQQDKLLEAVDRYLETSRMTVSPMDARLRRRERRRNLSVVRRGYAGLYDMSGNVEEWDDSCKASTGPDDYCRLRGGDTYPSFPSDPTYPLKCAALTSNPACPQAAARAPERRPTAAERVAVAARLLALSQLARSSLRASSPPPKPALFRILPASPWI